MVAERDLGRAHLARDVIEDAATQPGAQPAHRLAFGDDALHDGIGVLHLDAVGNAERVEVIGQDALGVPRVALIEVDGDELERNRRALAQLQEHVEQGVAVLAAGEAHHDAVAFPDHAVVADRLADEPAQAFFELSRLEALLAGEMDFFGRVHKLMLLPPSTAIIWPVTYGASAIK